MNGVRVFFYALGLMIWAWSTHPVLAADTLDEIYGMADRKEFDGALKRLNVYLAQHPQDAQGRFLKGLILTETRQREQAIAVFQQLSKDFPELPEPYNNLAVLYAEQGHFDKAQEALTQAIKAHPNYATAHENLGDIHAKMASQAYAKALKLVPGNMVLANKVTKVKTLFTEGGNEPAGSKATQTAAATTAAPAPLPKSTAKVESQRPAPVAAPEAASKPASTAVTPTPEPPQPKAEPEPVKNGEPAPAAPAPATAVEQPAPAVENVKTEEKSVEKPTEPERKPADKAALPSATAISEVKQTVIDWAAGWSAKNLEQYLGSYSARFQPTTRNFKTRDAWEKNRRDVIAKADAIHIQVAELQVAMLNENRAQATFIQIYTAKNYRDRVKKTLSLEREGQNWKIVREYAATE
ncbi:MAG: tetratricopeptide repeat protein [Magnetococcales bacterium]|nr:tetratricopeptide repeat protein [Magnetococcales bacterium]